MSNRGGGGTKKEASKMKIKPFPVSVKSHQFMFLNNAHGKAISEIVYINRLLYYTYIANHGP